MPTPRPGQPLSRLLTVHAHFPACDLDFFQRDTADGASVSVILILDAIGGR
jgi:uncharacterized protein (DUF983 family)